jgi:segregation and condensation protein B
MTAEQPGRAHEAPESPALPAEPLPAGGPASPAANADAEVASPAAAAPGALVADVTAAEDEPVTDGRGADAPPAPSDEQLPQRIEALLFVSDGGVDEGVLARALGVTRRRLDRALDALAEALREHGRGVRLQRGPEGAQLVTAPEAAAYVEYFLGLESARRLSTAALETLAIIAYRHPVTRGTIEGIRGVSSDAAIATLRARGLIADGGRAEGPGRPVLWVTTQRFLQHFGLERPEDLPPLPEGVDLPDEPAGAQLSLGTTTAEGDLAVFAQVAGATLAGHWPAARQLDAGEASETGVDPPPMPTEAATPDERP